MKKSLFTLALAIATAGLTGCATQPQRFISSTSFDPEKARILLSEGSNTIRGSALIRQRAGGVVSCAGKEISLVPATAYADEKIRALYGGNDRGYNRSFGGRRFSTEGEDPQYRQLVKTTLCDAQGFFKFDKVADGSFYVISVILWQVNDYFQEGGGLMRKIEVKGGEIKEIVLAP